MHQIGVVGLSYRHAGVDDVARFSLPKGEVVARLPELRRILGADEVFYVATCNRVEVLFTTSDGAAAGDSRREVFRALIGREPHPGEASRILRAWTGEAALEHLFLVACGLDSAQAGEQEIAAQIRGAWEDARTAQVCGPTLDRLISESLSMANRVHKLQSGLRPPSLADLAADRLLRHLSLRSGGTVPAVRAGSAAGPAGVAVIRPGVLNSTGRPAPIAPAPVALLGVSPMTKRCGMLLHAEGVPLVVVNRTLQAAEEFAQTVGGRAYTLDQFRVSPPDVCAVVLAAGGGEPVLDAAALAALAKAATRPPLLIDFGVPPNVDPASAAKAGFARVGMNELIDAAQERRLTQLMRLAPVRAAIDERLTRLRGELATRAIGHQLADLRGTFEQIAADEAERALAGELRTLDDSQRELLQRFASTVARRLAHLPLAGLRAAATHAGTDAIEAFFREAKLRGTVAGSEPAGAAGAADPAGAHPAGAPASGAHGAGARRVRVDLASPHPSSANPAEDRHRGRVLEKTKR